MARFEKASDGNRRDNSQEATLLLVLFLLALLPYFNALFNDFVYDDAFQVVENPYAHSFRYLPEIFTTTVWSFRGAAGVTNYYRPLMTFGYLLTYQIAGAVPFGFHLVNVAINGFVAWLVYFILRRFSGKGVAFVGAGLFALHPIHTESVAWIAGVTDLELTLFYLGAFYLYLGIPEGKRKIWPIVAMCVCFGFALLSKEQAMTLPILVTIYEHFFREDRATTTPGQKASRYGPLWIIAAVYMAVRAAVMGGLATVILRPNLTLRETILSAVTLTGEYVAKLIWPVHLSAFYPLHPSRQVTDPGVLWGLAAIALCAILFVVLWRRARLVSFALIMVFLPLGPVLNARWMPASVFGERYLYLPSLGLCWLVGWGAVQAWNGNFPAIPRPLARLAPFFVGLVAILFAFRTVSRNRDWRSDESLFRRAIEVGGESSLMRSNLGAILFNRGDFADAEHDWLEALSIGPSNAFALVNMALLRHKQCRYIESMDYSWRALRARPMYTFAHLNLAETLSEMGRAAEAEWQFRIATTLSPLSVRAHNSYGKFLLDQGRQNDALAEFLRSSEVDYSAEAYDHLGNLYRDSGDTPRAEKAFRNALAGNPFDTHAHFGLGDILESTGRPAEALREYESGLTMDPTDAVARAAVSRLRSGHSGRADAR